MKRLLIKLLTWYKVTFQDARPSPAAARQLGSSARIEELAGIIILAARAVEREFPASSLKEAFTPDLERQARIFERVQRECDLVGINLAEVDGQAVTNAIVNFAREAIVDNELEDPHLRMVTKHLIENQDKSRSN